MSELAHYGMPRRSGRYPWGSGKDPYQSAKNWTGYVNDMRSKGLSYKDIADGMGISLNKFRQYNSIHVAEMRSQGAAQAKQLRERGWSQEAIATRLNVSGGTVRNWLKDDVEIKAHLTKNVMNVLKEKAADGPLDIGKGNEIYLGVSTERLNTAVQMLQDEGYKIAYPRIEQLGTGEATTVKTLVPPHIDNREVYQNPSMIRTIPAYSDDGGKSFVDLQKPRSLDPNRVAVRYGDEGGSERDGLIEIRRGVDDISLGKANYAQVRIDVGGTHFMKGMAMYSDDLPKGVDVVYNTNKPKGTPIRGDKDNTVMKPLKEDGNNPFGSIVRQTHYIDKDGNKQLSALNIVGSPSKPEAGIEGAWEKWSKRLSSQMLSKQPPALAKQQLATTRMLKQDEYDEIRSLTNPTIKKHLLNKFADGADAAAAHLKAAALPGTSNHVILPFPSIKDNEVYAPNYENGTRVVLVRHPHGGPFEIPELTVNNRYPAPKKAIGAAKDAIGINHKVAERLSGADFDGDTVLVIPQRLGISRVRTAPPLKGLEGFDPKAEYPNPPNGRRMTKKGTGKAMGDISNLITDMTVRGANESEIARAVRHSMVVIDAEKHNLNYRQSAIDNGIAQLKAKYQGGARKGASTLISKSNATVRIPDRKPRPAKDGGPVDPATGRKVFVETGVPKTTKVRGMDTVDDALDLISGTPRPIEVVYAHHANELKAMANQARKEALATPRLQQSRSAKIAYAPEVEVLRAKVNNALKNAPLERKAQILANAEVQAKLQEDPDMDSDDLKKVKSQALDKARTRTGAGKERIHLTDKEWEAIQAGAVSDTFLTEILRHTDLDRVKELATPRTSTAMPIGKIARAKAMLAQGYTQSEVANALGVSTSTLNRALD